MNGTGSHRRRFRTASVAVVVGLAVMASGPAATAADVIQPPPVPLLPGVTGYPTVALGDDAIFVQVFNPNEDPAIYRRSMATSPTGITLGPAELVGRGALDGSIAAHAGTLAYARAIDGHLVLRAPDGTQTLPAWAGVSFARGIGDLTAGWVVATTLGSWPRLFRLADGAEVDLSALTPNPGGTQYWGAQGIEITDDRVLWSVHGHDPGTYWGVFTSAMDADGPTGPVITLEEHFCPADTVCVGDVLWDVDVVGDSVVWTQSVTNDVIAVRAFAGPPYEGEPAELLVAADAVADFTGTLVVRGHEGGGSVMLEWHDLLAANPAVPVHTVTLPAGDYSVGGTVSVGMLAGSNQLVMHDAVLPITADPTPAPHLAEFGDVPHVEGTSPWFSGEILWLADRGIVGGYPDGTFRGLAPVNRDAMAAFVYRAAHDGARAPACTTAPFSDVPASHPFCGEIAWLAAAGITTGWPDGTYRPATPVTREAMAAFLYRFASDGADAPACATPPFRDVVMANPFCGEISWLASSGITTGWPDGTFRPTVSIERQAMAAFLFRFIDGGRVPTT